MGSWWRVLFHIKYIWCQLLNYLETLFFLVVPLSIHVCFLIYVLVTRCEWQIWRMLLSTLVKFLGVLKRSIFKERTKFKNGMSFRTTLLFSITMIAPFILLGIHQSIVYIKCAPRWINIFVFSMLLWWHGLILDLSFLCRSDDNDFLVQLCRTTGKLLKVLHVFLISDDIFCYIST